MSNSRDKPHRTGLSGLDEMDDAISQFKVQIARLERVNQALRFTQIVSRSEAVISPEVADRIGGTSRVIDAVEMLYERVTIDPELGPYFKSLSETEMTHLIQQQARMFLALFGAGDYVGRKLTDAHHPHHITHDHFERLLDHVEVVLGRLDLGREEIDAFIAKLRDIEPSIVNPEGAPS